MIFFKSIPIDYMMKGMKLVAEEFRILLDMDNMPLRHILYMIECAEAQRINQPKK